MNINIVAACNEAYFKKSYPLFESWAKLPYKKQLLCIGFEAQLEGVETATCKLEDLKSFRTDFPSNRPFYVCAEGGEFLDYFNYEDNDIIVHIDVDMIIQRDFNEKELDILENLKYGYVLGNVSSIPYTTLREEYWKLKPKAGYLKAKEHFPNHWDKAIFCAGVVVCTSKTYRDVIAKNYLSDINKMVYHFDHHAAGQWIMNYVCNEFGKVVFMDSDFHNADWFIDTNCKEVKGKLYDKENRLVMFNHTKFNYIYYI